MPSSRIAVVVNGNAKSVTQDVISTIDQILAGGDLFVSRHLDEASEIAETLIERGYTTVLTGGGDGTFTVMVTAVVKAARERNRPVPRFGLLKLGTGNALAWVVGASPGHEGLKADIRKLQQDETRSREIRLVEVEGTLTPFAGLGADAQILADYAKTKIALSKTPLKPIAAGLFGYGVAAVTRSLPTFLFKKMPHFRVINDGGDAFAVRPGGEVDPKPLPAGTILFEGPARIAAVSTIPYVGFGMRLFPYADLMPARMHLRLSRVGSIEFVTHLPSVWDGTHHPEKTISDFLVEKVRIQSTPPTEFQFGGDPQGFRNEITAAVSESPIRLVDYYQGE